MSVGAEIKIKVKMFGFFDVTFRDKSIFLETTSSIKSVALLRFLISQKNKLFMSETIAENVWPENEYLDEKNVIRTYIHRLRKILTSENTFRKDFSEDIRILNVKGSYILETSENVEIDTDLLEGFKEAVLRESDPQKLMVVFDNMLSIYKGEYLEDCRYDHWVLMLRNYYLRLFCSIVNLILQKLEETRSIDEVIDVCEKSLKVYDLDESINIFFMKALIEKNQTTNALQHYNFITSKMYNELSVTPSEKMRSVYVNIKSRKGETGSEINGSVESIDTNTLMMMIDEAIRHQLAPDKGKFSIGFIKIVPNELYEGSESEIETDDDNIMESLRQAIEFALRKNDMYTLTSEQTALIVLADAKEESYPFISNRINQSFFSRHNGFNCKLNVQIYPSVKIF